MNHLTPVQTGSFLSFDETPIYFEVRGSGEPIVFVYGIVCLINHWHHQITGLSKDFKTIAFDLRGHHKSGVPSMEENLSITAMAKDIPLLLRELGIKKAHFVGHSFGVQVLLKLWEVAPEVVSSFTFINGFAKNPIKGMFGLDVVEPFFYFVKSNYGKNPQLLEALWQMGTNNQISMWATSIVGGFNFRVTEFKDIEIYAKGVAQMPLNVVIAYFEDMMRYSGEKSASSIQAPTLILNGENDSVTPLKFQHEMHAMIKGSEFVQVPYGSHCTQLDFPEFVNLKLKDFISRAR